MDWNQKNLKAFSLNDIETRVLQSLKTAKNPNDIGLETGIPRTSVAYNLKKLIERGLVKQVKFGKRHRYIALTPDQFALELRTVIDEIQIKSEHKKGARVKTTKDDEFAIHVGPGEIVPAFKRILLECKDERVKAIQHHRSFNDQVAVATSAQIVEFNNAIIKNRVIVDGILNEGAYESYKEEIKADPRKFKEEIESLGGRMADYHVFPDDRFDCDAEIWIFKTTTLIINWREKFAIEITNASMTSFIREMYEYVKGSSRKIDHNKMMREMLGQ